MNEVYLYPGQWGFAEEPTKISTLLGSCVSVVLFDSQRKVGGMNHYLLAEPGPNDEQNPRYGTVAIEVLIQAFLESGSNIRNIKAKIYGGGNVLSGIRVGATVGERNIELARQVLGAWKIPIVEEDVGGKQGRRIELQSWDFQVQLRKMKEAKGVAATAPKFPVRVGIIDDSLTVRRTFEKAFAQQGLEVVGVASNPFEAREMILKSRPEVLTLDIEMPHMNGVAFLEKLMMHHPLPVVMVSSLESGGQAALRALELGAVEYCQKPSQFDPQALRAFSEVIAEKIRAAAQVQVGQLKSKPKSTTVSSRPRSTYTTAMAAIGVGGNSGSFMSVVEFVRKIPADTPPILIANSAMAGLFESLQKAVGRSDIQIRMVEGQEVVSPGGVYLAPAFHHLEVVPGFSGVRVAAVAGQPIKSQLPSADRLFKTGAAALGSRWMSLMFGGFGSDGLEGLGETRLRGGVTAVEDPSLSAFAFIPEAAVAQGLADHVLSAAQMVELINHLRSQAVA